MKLFLSTFLLFAFHFLQAQSIEAIVIDPLCSGEDSGSIDVTFTAGTPPYMYQWSNGANTEDIEFLVSGSYSLTITDNQNQNYVGDWVIGEPTMLIVDGVVQDPNCNSNSGPLDGAIDIFSSGGTEESTYIWSGPGVDGSTDESLFELAEGSYQVTATDGNGCTAVADFFVIEPDEIVIEANIQNLDCIDGQSQFGSIELNVVGGFAPYTYYWNGNISNPNSESQIDLIAGIYTVEVTDANGCSAEQEYELTGADPIELSATISTIDCDGSETVLGSIELNVIGGVPPYVYNWTGTDVDPTAQNQSNLDEGVYFVTVSDSEGCQLVDEVFEMHTAFIASPSLCLITNDNPDGFNTVYWEDPEDLTGVDQFNIYREGSSVGQFDLIGTVDLNSDNEFFDTDANSIQQAYRYYVTSADACGYESEPSAIHKTIHLTINQGSFGNINLIWDEYDGIQYDQIVIYRGDSPSTLEEFIVLPGNVFSYTDDNTLGGDAYYQIVITTTVECNTTESPLQKLIFELKSNVAGYFVNSIEDVDWLTDVYPNPFGDHISIVLESKAHAQLIDANGVLINEVEMLEGLNRISTEQLSRGVYFVRFVSKNEVAIWKGIKGL